MRERPIPFSPDMVRAVLDGRKTQTRRLAKVPPSQHGDAPAREIVPSLLSEPGLWDVRYDLDNPRAIRSPYGIAGDRLWVREAWRSLAGRDREPPRNLRPYESIHYLADGPPPGDGWGRYRHARFMPRVLSRIDLRVAGVRVERLQEITEADVRAEGIEAWADTHLAPEWRERFGVTPELFAFGWDGINGDRAPWASNPWVWVVSFKMEVTNG